MGKSEEELASDEETKEKLLQNSNEEVKGNPYDKLNVISVVVVIISISTIAVIGYDECRRCFITQNSQRTHKPLTTKTFRTYGRNSDGGHLKHVFKVLHRLGYVNSPNSTDWDLLWAHDYPFRAIFNELNKLEPHQKVNHFPGCGYLTNKVDLATSDLPYVPKAFKLSKDKEKLLKFADDNPQKEFVLKNNDHRNVRVKKLTEIDLDSNDSFVQEFINKPLLVSGYMFDIGIYTIITSIDPLRLYIYNGDFLLRFCPEKYYPFDPNNLDKYVVGDDYLPTWQVPALKHYYNELGYSMRESLAAYLKERGQDASIIWRRIEDALSKAVLAKEPLILSVTNKFKYKSNFFEMMRFDFVIDENLGVHLMEANMSPNLSSAHFKPNQLLYEQVIYNLFGLVGIGERVKKDSLKVRSYEEETMQATFKNIAVMPNACKKDCWTTCDLIECELCKPCMSEETEEELYRAHREHLNRGDCKRIFPPTMNADEEIPEDVGKLSMKNQLIYKWFYEKCKIDSRWCS